MITAESKPFNEIINYIKPYHKILLIGCNECVTVCSAGGRKEVEILSSAIQIYFLRKGKNIKITEHTLERQCEPEYIEELSSISDNYEVIVSMACGCGVQELSRKFNNKPVFPALNTKFMGSTEQIGVWVERCRGCGECILGYTGGICPIARCSKQIMNGPCGGSSGGKCEISPEVDCVWQLIWNRLKALGIENEYTNLLPAKDWRSGYGGGPRKIIKKDLLK